MPIPVLPTEGYPDEVRDDAPVSTLDYPHLIATLPADPLPTVAEAALDYPALLAALAAKDTP